MEQDLCDSGKQLSLMSSTYMLLAEYSTVYYNTIQYSKAQYNTT